jgi:predicted nucleic acid-binding protein
MIGSDFMIDTNVAIYILEGKSFMLPFLVNIKSISIISEIELRGYHGITDNDERIIRTFLHDLKILPINHYIKEFSINLRKEYKLKTPDAIIAATAIVEKMSLISADAHFKRIKELDLIFIEL